jgi:arsenite-transporting ATPase
MRILYFTGKGGTGKSVVSALTALRLAEYGHRTILVSSDPAHSIRDVLNGEVGRDPTKITSNFYAINIDPVLEAARHYSVILDYIASVFKARGIDEILAYEIASLPGMTGIATMLKLDMLAATEEYDVIVIDTVPSGEALRYLYVPAIMGKISRRFMKIIYPLADIGKIFEPVVGIPAPSKDIIKREIELLEMIERVRGYLVNPDITSIRLVANPDSFSIANTRRTYIQASIYGLNTDLIIMNKILPEEVTDPFFHEWLDGQSRYINEAVNSFKPVPIKFLRLFKKELKGLSQLRLAADELYGDEDPIKIYHKGDLINIEREDDYLIIKYPTPFLSKKDLEIERIGDELIIHLYTDAGPIDLVVPLPTITFKMNIVKAKLMNRYLYIYFKGDQG